MPRPYRVVAFSGSLRQGSTNTALVLMAQRLCPKELQIEIVDWVDQLPWMNPDLEADPPEIVTRWWDTLRAADALLVGMPEYNWSPTPLAKNAIDWATRPPDDRAIARVVVAFISSSGRSGGVHAQEKLTTILGYLAAGVVADPPVQLVRIADRIRPDGTTDDLEIEAAVRAKLDAMVTALDAREEDVTAQTPRT
jgi:chromate reductase